MYVLDASRAHIRLRCVTDWATVASLATAGGTLVLAVATFASIRSSNRSARIAERAARAAERSLLAGQISVRNVGSGLAVLLGWHVQVGVQQARSHPSLDEFAGQRRDIYVPPGDVGFWQAALRDPLDQPDPREGE